MSWVTVTLEAEVQDRTRLELDHVAHVPDDFWAQYGPGARGVGWELGLMGLDEHLRTGADMPPEASEWPASADGRAFVRESSEAWGRASIAAGTDEADAMAAAARTTAFYTGEGGVSSQH